MVVEVHEGWKGIAGALNRSIKTAREWANRRGLPVRRLAGTVYMKASDHADWVKTNDKPFLEEAKDRESAAPTATAEPSKAA